MLILMMYMIRRVQPYAICPFLCKFVHDDFSGNSFDEYDEEQLQMLV
jgi:hypothetical protein